MIEWFARNHVASNLLMLTIILSGYLSIRDQVALELMPDFQLGTVSITTILPGGNPKSIENTISTRIEEAIADIDGIKNITSRSDEKFSIVMAEIENGYNENEVLSDIKVRVDALNTLPIAAERPIIQLAEAPFQVIGVAVYSDLISAEELYTTASRLREKLQREPGITKVSELNAAPREFHIDISPDTLKQYNLSLELVGIAIQNNAVDISAGNLKTKDGDILIRANAQAYTAEDFGKVPVVNKGNNTVYLKDIATITDGHMESDVQVRFDKKPALTFDVFRSGTQNTIAVADAVLNFVEREKSLLPDTVLLNTYWNTSRIVKDRLNMLIENALMGGLLVIILLSFFLRPAVALWVGLGIPICFLGAFAVMPHLGLSLNMLTMFAFILVLGIVVDDAIVTGENIYRHIRQGMPPEEAAIFGAKEVAVPVTFGVITTMVAFAPMLMVTGVLSSLTKQVPLIVIPVLAFSLIESKFILPSHMGRIKPRDEDNLSGFSKFQMQFARKFERSIITFYRPFLDACIRNKTITIIMAVSVFLITMSGVSNGWLKSTFLPEFEDDAIFISLTMPSTTGFETTKKYIDHIAEVGDGLKQKYVDSETGESLINYIFSAAGVSPDNTGAVTLISNKGIVVIELAPSEVRQKYFALPDFIQELKNNIGEIPGAEKMTISASFADFGRPLSIVFYGNDLELMGEKINDVRDYLKTYPGVFDIQDNYSSGKEEIQIELLPMAHSLGITHANLATQVRNAVFGYESQRIQRGHDELKVMVRYPIEYRSSYADIKKLPIKVKNSSETIPLSDLASLHPAQSPNAIYHDKRKQAITISADVAKTNVDLNIIRTDLKVFLDKLLIDNPTIEYDMDGQAKVQREATSSLGLGLIVVLLVIYALLAIPLKSFIQPLIVMSVIPISIVGAIIGHALMGHDISVFSLMGVLALVGIVVNDSLVLVDYINQERSRGKDVLSAVLNAGEVRFRPVILTSLTTFVGLVPLMFSSSMQAQNLIPMAISLGFGIVIATVVTLLIIPVNYLVYYQLSEKFSRKAVNQDLGLRRLHNKQ